MSWKKIIKEAPRFSNNTLEIVKLLGKRNKHVGWRVITKRGKNKGQVDLPLNANLYEYGEPEDFTPSYQPIYLKDD